MRRIIRCVHCQLQSNRSFTKEITPNNDVAWTASLIKQRLSLCGIYFTEGYANFIASCPGSEAESRKNRDLFINKTTGHFFCYNCHFSGSWSSLAKMIDSSMQSSSDGNRMPCQKARIHKTGGIAGSADHSNEQSCTDDLIVSKRLTELTPDEFKATTERLGIQKLTSGTLDEYGLRLAPDGSSLMLPSFRTDLTVLSVRKIVDSVRGGSTYIPSNSVVMPFGWHVASKADETIVLTSCEFDAMAVRQETDLPAVSLCSDLSYLPQETSAYLERFKKIIIYFGDDAKSWALAKYLSRKLDASRCWCIRPTKQLPTALKALQSSLRLSDVLRLAVPFVHPNIVTFHALREQVLYELQNAHVIEGVKWKRYPTLNKLLKGHRPGELTVFTGPTGSGKTTFISDYALDLAEQGVSTLWGSFEIQNVRLAKKMITQFAKTDLTKTIDKYDMFADKFQELPIYFMTFFGQQEIGRLIETMNHAVKVYDIKHAVIDNLQFMMGHNENSSVDRFSKQDHVIAQLRKFATNANCHITLVIHPKKVENETNELTTQSVFGSAKATQEADNVLILQDYQLPSGGRRKFLQVTKNRFDGELGMMPLKFDKESQSFAYKQSTDDGKSKVASPLSRPEEEYKKRTRKAEAAQSDKQVEEEEGASCSN